MEKPEQRRLAHAGIKLCFQRGLSIDELKIAIEEGHLETYGFNKPFQALKSRGELDHLIEWVFNNGNRGR